MSKKNHNQWVVFNESLADDDYGLVIDKDGHVKGIWIPEKLINVEEVPEKIAKICLEYFGLDPNNDSSYTLH